MTGKPAYDRKIVIDNRNDFDRFIEEPEMFLREKGMLDGLPAFNGVVGLETEESKLRMIARFKQRQIVVNFHIDGPVPDFCKWTDEPLDPGIDD